jgi:hypothetical protein
MIVAQQVRNITPFCGTPDFITMLTRAHYWTQFLASLIQLTASHPVSSEGKN